MKYLCCLFVALLMVAPGALAQDPEAGRLFAERYGCQRCHGVGGVGGAATVPNLAGQKATYLRRQLESFRRNQPLVIGGEVFRMRTHPQMDAMSAILTDHAINDLAAYYARLPCAPPAKAPQSGVPAAAAFCEVCHGGQRSNPFAYSPNLNSQDEAYLLAQLVAFRDSYRKADGTVHESSVPFHRSHRIMSEFVTGDLAALSKYFAGLACR